MVWGAIIGAAGSLISGSKASKNAKAAAEAAKFQPYGVGGLSSGGVRFEDGRILVNPSEKFKGIQGTVTDRAGGLLGGENEIDQIAQGYRNEGLSQVGGLFQSALNAPDVVSDAALRTAGRMEGLGLFQNALGQAGVGQAFDSPLAQQVTAGLAERGRGMLDEYGGVAGLNSISAQRLTAMREAARPSEQRAVDTKFNKLFSQGRLGTTGGQRGLGELALQQELADQARVVSSMDFAQQFQNQQQLLGLQMFDPALRGTQLDQSRAANLGNLGTNMFSQGAQNFGAELDARKLADSALFGRAGQRLALAQNLFGFGTDVQNAEIGRAGQLLGITQSIDQNLLDQARVGASVGQAQSAANANAGQFTVQQGSPFGAALQGLGMGLGDKSFSELFRKSPPPTASTPPNLFGI